MHATALTRWRERRNPRLSHAFIPLAVFCGASRVAAATDTPYDVINRAAASSPITVHKLRGGVSMLEGSGGNIGVLVGPHAKLMVDCGIAVSQDKIRKALADLGPGPIRYAIDTHWHWDHTDGNAWVRQTGADLIAHRLADRRLSQTLRIEEWGHTFAPATQNARPTTLLTQARLIEFAGEKVRIRPYQSGHTDGDLSVKFEKANVLQTGDTFWNGMYPFIDYVAGGSIDGAIAEAKANLAMSDSRTLVIPGHGPVGDRAALVDFHHMLVAVREQVAKLKAQGLSLQAVQAARPTAAYDARWGKSLISGQLFTALVYRGV